MALVAFEIFLLNVFINLIGICIHLAGIYVTSTCKRRRSEQSRILFHLSLIEIAGISNQLFRSVGKRYTSLFSHSTSTIDLHNVSKVTDRHMINITNFSEMMIKNPDVYVNRNLPNLSFTHHHQTTNITNINTSQQNHSEAIYDQPNSPTTVEHIWQSVHVAFVTQFLCVMTLITLDRLLLLLKPFKHHTIVSKCVVRIYIGMSWLLAFISGLSYSFITKKFLFVSFVLGLMYFLFTICSYSFICWRINRSYSKERARVEAGDKERGRGKINYHQTFSGHHVVSLLLHLTFFLCFGLAFSVNLFKGLTNGNLTKIQKDMKDSNMSLKSLNETLSDRNLSRVASYDQGLVAWNRKSYDGIIDEKWQLSVSVGLVCDPVIYIFLTKCYFRKLCRCFASCTWDYGSNCI